MGKEPMNPFTARVVELIRDIPEGRVMTYGQIAAEAGNPRGARQVVRILHALSVKERLPWHRVVNRQGVIALKEDEARYEQRLRLEREGIRLDDRGCVELEQYRYIPPEAKR